MSRRSSRPAAVWSSIPVIPLRWVQQQSTSQHDRRSIIPTATNDNMVLMYATPMTYYEYQVKYPDDTKKGNSPKLTSAMTLAVPGNPSMNMVSVDTYNEAASAYEGMQQIGSNLHLGTPGQPNTYRSSLPSGTQSWAIRG